MYYLLAKVICAFFFGIKVYTEKYIPFLIYHEVDYLPKNQM